MTALLTTISAAAALLSGCGGSPPELLQLFRQKNVVFDVELDVTYESMSLWINCSDDDGTEDFAYLYLINDEEELYWELTDEMWSSDERDSGYWIGTNDIVMHDKSAFPPGNYRVVLIDAAGERDENRFFVSSGPGHGDLVFPRLIPGPRWEFRSPHRENFLWVYESGGNLVGSYSIEGIEGNRFDPEKIIEGIVRTEEDRKEEDRTEEDRKEEDRKEEDRKEDEEREEPPVEALESGPVTFHAYAYDDDRGVGLVTKTYDYMTPVD